MALSRVMSVASQILMKERGKFQAKMRGRLDLLHINNSLYLIIFPVREPGDLDQALSFTLKFIVPCASSKSYTLSYTQTLIKQVLIKVQHLYKFFLSFVDSAHQTRAIKSCSFSWKRAIIMHYMTK